MLTFDTMKGRQHLLFFYSFCLPGIRGFISSSSLSRLYDNHRCCLQRQQSPLFAFRKTDDEVALIQQSLRQNAMFSTMSEPSIQNLVENFEKKTGNQGRTIVEQGESTRDGYVYLITEGKCRVLVDGKEVPEPYNVIGAVTLFGDLGVLYEETRAATISVDSATIIYYQILGSTFKDILNAPTESLSTMREIDDIINQVSGTQPLYEGDIILPYKPERTWLWRQFSGTLLKLNLQTTLLNMLVCAAFCIYAREVTGQPFFADPDTTIPLVYRFSLVREVWDIQKALTTFVLTFFVNQSFAFWREVYKLTRDVQQHVNNFNFVVATHAKRNEDGSLTCEATEFLEDIGQFSRLYHILLWASKAKRFSALATTDGLARMESRGLMTSQQRDVIQRVKVANDQLYHAPLEWMMIRSNQAMANGVLASDTATKGVLLKEITSMRNSARSISDKLNGRMPLAYVHFVQILVDSFVFTAPIALFTDLGECSVFAVGLVTLFYTGLNNLGKIFLDPLNNEEFCENSIFMDLAVLIRETNGISTQWMKAGEEVPF
jgi:hypothetical protein